MADALTAWWSSVRGQTGWSRTISKRSFVGIQILIVIPLCLLTVGVLSLLFYQLAGWEPSLFTWLFSGIVIPLCLGIGSGVRWDQDQQSLPEGKVR